MCDTDLIPIIDAAEKIVEVNFAVVASAEVNGRDNGRLLLLRLKEGETITLDLQPLIATAEEGGHRDADLIRSHELAETVASANPETVKLVQVDNRSRENEGYRAQLLIHLIKDRSIIVFDLLDLLAVPRNGYSPLNGKTVLSC